eukprot:4187300-Amphidinium_carterae.1
MTVRIAIHFLGHGAHLTSCIEHMGTVWYVLRLLYVAGARCQPKVIVVVSTAAGVPVSGPMQPALMHTTCSLGEFRSSSG